MLGRWFAAGETYTQKVQALLPIAYWPFADPSGSVATDESGNSRDGAYSNVTLGATGIGDGRTAATFNGSTSYVNIYSASFAAAFSGSTGTVALWARVSAAGVWTDTTVRRFVVIQADANNILRFHRLTTNNVVSYQAFFGGVNSFVNFTTGAPTGWFHIAITWDKPANQMKAYFAGAQVGTTQTIGGTWAGSPAATTTVVGAANTTPIERWSGDIAHVAVWTSALTSTQIASLATV